MRVYLLGKRFEEGQLIVKGESLIYRNRLPFLLYLILACTSLNTIIFFNTPKSQLCV